MEKSSNGVRSFLPELFSAEELEVSEILLQLPHLIAETFPLRVGFSWGATRKRSALVSTPPPPVSFSSSPLPFVPGSGVSEPKRDSESPPTATNKVVALSPATPLAFFPSESDENPKSSKKKSALKKKKEEWVGFVDGLTQRRDFLKGINAELERVKIESEFANLKLESSPASVVDYPPSLIKDQTSHTRPNETYYSSICGFGARDLNLSPLGIPDLNISLDESQGGESPQALDMSRAMAAQARQKRIQIYRMKNSAANKPRLSSR